MKIKLGKKTFEVVKSRVVRFSWKPHRLTMKYNPPIYHWFWFTYSFLKEK
jgi:hypothetical protein